MMDLDKLVLVEFNSSISEDEVERDLIESRIVGLMTINNGDKLFAVCLVTSGTIYLFDPNIRGNSIFISKQLHNKRIKKIFTIHGMKDALLLDQIMGIKIYVKKGTTNIGSPNHRLFDLETFEQQCELRQNMLDKMKYFYKKDPYTLQFIHKKFEPKNLDYHQLVSKYLDCDINVKFSDNELEAIEFKLMSEPEAIKRCVGPLGFLAEKMYQTMKDRRLEESRNLMRMNRCTDSDLWEQYLRTQDRSVKKLYSFIESLPSNHQE